MSAWVDVAVLTGTKTLDGRLVVRNAPGLPFLLSEGLTVHFVPPVTDVPRNGIIEEIQEGAGGDYIVRFNTVKDKTAAGKLLGCHVLMSREDLDAIQAALADQSFIGYDVVDEEMGLLGTVEALEQMPAQFLLSVKPADDGPSFYIPFVEEFILEVNADDKVISVDIPVGLLEL